MTTALLYIMHRHICAARHMRARMPREDEICLPLQTNKPSLARQRTPDKDGDCVLTEEKPRALCATEEQVLLKVKEADRQGSESRPNANAQPGTFNGGLNSKRQG